MNDTNHYEGFEMPSQTIFEKQMEELRIDMREMRTAIVKMADAMSKLAVLEERNLAQTTTIEKLTERVGKNEDKLVHVEIDQIKFQATVDGVSKTMKMMWGAFGGGVIFLGAQLVKQFAPGIGG